MDGATLETKSRQDNPLDQVIVRPIHFNERSRWKTLMANHHYLGFKSLVGESLRYVAEIQSQWVALLGWSAAALQCHPRDTWIGWPSILRWQRLSLIVNNARFLILPEIHIPNLASKILSLNLKRLSKDWEHIYGHPVVLAETFVDSQRFRGTCYQAANWIYLGQTQGFGKSAQGYFYHGQSKAVFVRPLNQRARRWLTDPVGNPKLIGKVNPMKLTIQQTDDLIKILKTLPDPRKKRGIRHRQLSILALALGAVLSGARRFTAMAEWAQRCSQNILERLWCRFDDRQKRYLPPSEPTIRRLLQTINPEVVDQQIGGWLSSLFTSQAIGLDGKTLKGARLKNGSQIKLLSAFVHQEGITIAPKEIPAAHNEITIAPSLLESLPLTGKVVTADALHTQKELARYIVENKQADYCFTVKDNQKTLKEDIATFSLTENFPPSPSNL